MAVVNFTIGDYKYSSYGDLLANNEVAVTVKSTEGHDTGSSIDPNIPYDKIPATVTYNGVTYTVTTLYETYAGCEYTNSLISSMQRRDQFPDTVTSMERCFAESELVNFSANIPIHVENMAECFSGCASLTTFNNNSEYSYRFMPETLEEITKCFEGCVHLRTIIGFSPKSTFNYTLSYATYMFDGCSSLIQPPEFPTSVTRFSGAFRDCSSLLNVPVLHDGITRLDYAFDGCSSLTSPYWYRNLDSGESLDPSETYYTRTGSGTASSPYVYTESDSPDPSTPQLYYERHGLPSTIYGRGLEGTFKGCYNLLEAPKLPTTNEYGLEFTFEGCSSLTVAPSIPSNCNILTRTFGDCTSLSGSVNIAGGVTPYMVFDGTALDIYVIPDSNLSSLDISMWRTECARNSNVHYFGDDATLNVKNITSVRVGSSGSSTESDDGEYAHILVEIEKGGLLPSGYSQLVSYSLSKDGATPSPAPTWSDYEQSTDISEKKETWCSANISSGTNYVVTITDQFGNVATLSTILPSASVLLDFHAGGDGMAIGTVCEGPGLTVAMESEFTENVLVTGALNVQTRLGIIANSDNYSALRFQSSNRTADAIKNYGSGYDYGDAMVIGNGGLMVIGSGESAQNWFDRITGSSDPTYKDYLVDNERTFVTSDNQVYIVVNGNTIANRSVHTFDTSGLYLGNAQSKTGALATSSNNGVTADELIQEINLRDKNNEWTGRFCSYFIGSAGQVTTYLQARNKKTDGTIVTNSIAVHVKKDGSQTYGVSNAANFRSAIGAVNKAGDTMTGTLTLSSNTSATRAVIFKNSDVTINTSSNNAVDGTNKKQIYPGMSIFDSADYYYAEYRATCDTSGKVWAYINARNKKTDGTAVTNQLQIGVTKAGGRYISVSESKPWRTAIEAMYSVKGAGDFYGMGRPDGNTTDWIRTTTNGLIPAASGGSGAIGTSSWPFNTGYIKEIYMSGTSYRALKTGNNNDRINYMSRASDYLHVETVNYGSKGVTWWSSDVRLKENIEDSEVDALELVNSIQHRSFTMKETGTDYDIGFIAQELEELDPQLVLKVPNSRVVGDKTYFTGDYRYQIDERKLIPYLTRSIQQLSAENEELKAKNAELESRIAAIEERLGL